MPKQNITQSTDMGAVRSNANRLDYAISKGTMKGSVEQAHLYQPVVPKVTDGQRLANTLGIAIDAAAQVIEPMNRAEEAIDKVTAAHSASALATETLRRLDNPYDEEIQAMRSKGWEDSQIITELGRRQLEEFSKTPMPTAMKLKSMEVFGGILDNHHRAVFNEEIQSAKVLMLDKTSSAISATFQSLPEGQYFSREHYMDLKEDANELGLDNRTFMELAVTQAYEKYLDTGDKQHLSFLDEQMGQGIVLSSNQSVRQIARQYEALRAAKEDEMITRAQKEKAAFQEKFMSDFYLAAYEDDTDLSELRKQLEWNKTSLTSSQVKTGLSMLEKMSKGDFPDQSDPDVFLALNAAALTGELDTEMLGLYSGSLSLQDYRTIGKTVQSAMGVDPVTRDYIKNLQKNTIRRAAKLDQLGNPLSPVDGERAAYIASNYSVWLSQYVKENGAYPSLQEGDKWASEVSNRALELYPSIADVMQGQAIPAQYIEEFRKLEQMSNDEIVEAVNAGELPEEIVEAYLTYKSKKGGN